MSFAVPEGGACLRRFLKLGNFPRGRLRRVGSRLHLSSLFGAAEGGAPQAVSRRVTYLHSCCLPSGQTSRGEKPRSVRRGYRRHRAGSLSAALVLGRACRKVLLCDNDTPRNWASKAIHGFLTRDGTAPADFRKAVGNYGGHAAGSLI